MVQEDNNIKVAYGRSKKERTVKNKQKNFRFSKEAFHWYAITCFSSVFLLATSIIDFFDATRESSLEISDLVGIAFTLTIAELYDAWTYLDEHNLSTNDKLYRLLSANIKVGIFITVFEIFIYTINYCIVEFERINILYIVTFMLIIAAFFYGYHTKKIIICA